MPLVPTPALNRDPSCISQTPPRATTNQGNGTLESCEFQVVDLSGRTCMLRPLQGGQRLDLTHLNGIYLLVARTANGIQTSKVILGE